MGAIEVITLSDGGQTADEIARRVADFLRPARSSLELALYDVRLPYPTGSIVADELRAAESRGVAARLLYNVDTARPSELHPPPRTRPEILAELPIDARPVPGIPDLMHHKYAVRDDEAVWTGSTNWTIDSWTRQENVIAIVTDGRIAQRFRRNFEELWANQDVERSGRVAPEPVDVDGARVTAWFTPGHGEQLSQRIATAIGAARTRVRIASPVITSGPILGTLAELTDKGGRDIAGVVDGPQTETVFHQWRENRHTAWKIPLLAAILSKLPFSAKPSTPWTPELEVHDFMHAKVTIADDVVFLGSFNLSRSGEQNAESVLEIQDPALAERLARFVDEVRGRYPEARTPAVSRNITSSTPSASSA
ncbi:MAG TPA: phospholipase D-like domain-containing protein [Solirubrobacterales bacterium]|jgi:phosphatidylserine/phosphatidylglycerophosphate/cardiolipin synthase-like enzyme|nr:phospholipase D-like domain-containing protein [Solirubrobacterales bacterium]